jgi:hypothetical protein
MLQNKARTESLNQIIKLIFISIFLAAMATIAMQSTVFSKQATAIFSQAEDI